MLLDSGTRTIAGLSLLPAGRKRSRRIFFPPLRKSTSSPPSISCPSTVVGRHRNAAVKRTPEPRLMSCTGHPCWNDSHCIVGRVEALRGPPSFRLAQRRASPSLDPPYEPECILA